ncbi:hypothetical protein N7G274_006675 [Stereocaulon virgatum]|uniref:Thaumatin-like protein n=1 Tax=Stereocaulon virgatum TaxID=373712 RepID=A0ABR4A716_9LECA
MLTWALAFFTSSTSAINILSRIPIGATSTSTTLGTAHGNALRPQTTLPPNQAPKPAFAGGSDLTINIINSYSIPLSIFYGSNAGAPTPVDNPGPGTLASSTQVLFPSDWAGRITIGQNYDPEGSKIEASLSGPNYIPDVDISYVDGYTVPISCSCQGVAVTGCNIELFNDGQNCPNVGPGPICYNPEENVPDGPAAPFFAPCAGAAYTYPNDNAANSYGQCNSGVIDCCIGSRCPAPARQPR